MNWLYNSAIISYGVAIKLAALFNQKARLWVQGRNGIFDRIENELKDVGVIWFHCASLGEFEQARPLFERIKKLNPKEKLFITFFSPSGYEIRKNYKGIDYVFYLPLDLPSNAERFAEIVRPKAAYFIKYEFWYNYFRALHKRSIPIYVVSANFRADHRFFKWYGGWFRKTLELATHFFVQNENSHDLLNSIGIKNATISGDTRFDRVNELASSIAQIPVLSAFKGKSKLLVIGSSWKEDMEVLLPAINSNVHGLKFVIAPHEIHPAEIQQLSKSIKLNTVIYSEQDEQSIKKADVLILNTIGLLGASYAYADLAYVGGGFGAGLHNILEPAAYGVPVLFGYPKQRFVEAFELIEKGGAFAIKNTDDLNNRLNFLFSDPYVVKMAGQMSRSYIQENLGSTQCILNNTGVKT